MTQVAIQGTFQNGFIVQPFEVSTKMASITVKSIPDKLYERLKQNATERRRSINSEIIYCLEQYLGSRRLDPDEFLARADSLREQVGLPPVTEKFLHAAKEAGRP